MNKLAISLTLAALAAATSAKAQEVVVQIAPTTPYSTIDCANFAKTKDKLWVAVHPVPYNLGFVHKIVPPKYPIKSGSYIYNNVDLYSQLNEQCGSAPVVHAKY